MKISRSLLAVPGSDLRMIEKALASEADMIFLDLEDAVAPGGKSDARKNIIRALKELDWEERPSIYRINALDTPYFYGDVIEVAEEAGSNLDTILVPKVEKAADLHTLDILLRSIERNIELEPGKIKLEAQIENARGLTVIDEICHATDRLEVLHFGPGDYAASMKIPYRSIGVTDEWDEAYGGHRFHYPMHRIVTAARAAGHRALDGPVADYSDEEGLRKSCLTARALGFDGKWCIHPAQIQTVNEVFSPTEEEVDWAKKVVAAYEEAGKVGRGAIAVDGQMVDAASIRMARSTLDLAQVAGIG